MRSIFANKGVPAVCQSNNGSPFQSQEMADFAKHREYSHHHVTPEWPRANRVERFNRSMKTALQAANLEGTMLCDAAVFYTELPHRDAIGITTDRTSRP